MGFQIGLISHSKQILHKNLESQERKRLEFQETEKSNFARRISIPKVETQTSKWELRRLSREGGLGNESSPNKKSVEIFSKTHRVADLSYSLSPFVKRASTEYSEAISEINKVYRFKTETEEAVTNYPQDDRINAILRESEEEIVTLTEGLPNRVDLIAGNFKMLRILTKSKEFPVHFDIKVDSGDSSKEGVSGLMILVKSDSKMTKNNSDFRFFFTSFNVSYPNELNLAKFFMAIHLSVTKTVLIEFKFQPSSHGNAEGKIKQGSPVLFNRKKSHPQKGKFRIIGPVASKEDFDTLKTMVPNFNQVIQSIKIRKQEQKTKGKDFSKEFITKLAFYKESTDLKQKLLGEQIESRISIVQRKKKEKIKEKQKEKEKSLTRHDQIKAKVTTSWLIQAFIPQFHT